MEKSSVDSALGSWNEFLVKRSKNDKHDYSLIHSLLRLNDEVRLHSKFLYSMLNPESTHYQGNRFLLAFLNELPFSLDAAQDINQKFDLENAVVLCEQDNIDLLIHDNEHFIIIENKLNAVDQKHQITRYIKQVIETYELDINTDINKNIFVVYLSKGKSIPVQNDSLIGFTFEEDKNHKYITWKEDKPIKITKSTKGFYLPLNTKFEYCHLPYFTSEKKGSIQNWIKQCQIGLLDEELNFAFTEYAKIISRLDKKNYRKNLMSLTDYFFDMQDNTKQKELLSLILESKKEADSIISIMLHRALQEYFTNSSAFKDIKEDYWLDSDHFNRSGELQLKPLNENTLERWLKKKGQKNDWKDIGFIIQSPNDFAKGIAFIIGVDFLYYGYFTSTTGFADKPPEHLIAGQTFHQFNRLLNIREALCNGDIDAVISCVTNQEKKLLEHK